MSTVVMLATAVVIGRKDSLRTDPPNSLDHRRNDDGCSVFVIKEYAYDVLKTPVTTAIGHPVVPCRYRSVQAMLIRLPRGPF